MGGREDLIHVFFFNGDDRTPKIREGCSSKGNPKGNPKGILEGILKGTLKEILKGILDGILKGNLKKCAKPFC